MWLICITLCYIKESMILFCRGRSLNLLWVLLIRTFLSHSGDDVSIHLHWTKAKSEKDWGLLKKQKTSDRRDMERRLNRTGTVQEVLGNIQRPDCNNNRALVLFIILSVCLSSPGLTNCLFPSAPPWYYYSSHLLCWIYQPSIPLSVLTSVYFSLYSLLFISIDFTIVEEIDCTFNTDLAPPCVFSLWAKIDTTASFNVLNILAMSYLYLCF